MERLRNQLYSPQVLIRATAPRVIGGVLLFLAGGWLTALLIVIHVLVRLLQQTSREYRLLLKATLTMLQEMAFMGAMTILIPQVFYAL